MRWRDRVLLLGAVVLVGGGGVSAATRWPAAASPPGGTPPRIVLAATGVAATPVCPGPPTLLAPTGGDASPPGGPVAVGALVRGSTATLADRPLVPGSGGLAALTLPRTAAGAVTLLPAGGAGGGAAGAPEVSAVQLELARTGDARGLAAVPCATATTQSWLVGGGTQVGRRARLLLANPAPTAATVDVVVHGPQGVVAAARGAGVLVPARSEVALQVDALAPDLATVAVQVTARNGRVTAVLHDSWLRGVTPGGVDDVSAAAAPARTQWVPGIVVAPPPAAALPDRADAPGAVAVRVANPGPDPAVVRVRLLGADGSRPLDHGVVTLAPGAVVDVPVTGVPAGPWTAAVQADVPVVAGAVVGRGGPAQQPAEFGWTSSVEPVTAPALLALPTLTDAGGRTDVEGTLLLTATGAAASVEVTELDGRAGVAAVRTVAVAAGSTAVQRLGAGAAGVRLRPLGAGAAAPVVAALVLTVADDAGPLLAVVPFRPGASGGGSRPEVVADVRLGLGGR